MLPYPVWQIGLLLVHLRDVEWTSKGFRHPNSPVESDVASVFLKRLDETRKKCRDLKLTGTLDRIDGLVSRLRVGLTISDFGDEIRFLNETIYSELKARLFVFVPPEKAERINKLTEEWGGILVSFPSARDDINAAVECYALDCNTACVFHSMRVAERGMRTLAKSLKVRTIGPQKHPLEFAEWGLILSALAGKLKASSSPPEGALRRRRLQNITQTLPVKLIT